MEEASVEMSPAKLAVVRSYSIFINSTVTAARSVAGVLELELVSWPLPAAGLGVSALLVFAELELAAGLDLSVRLQSESIAIKENMAMIEFIWYRLVTVRLRRAIALYAKGAGKSMRPRIR